MFWPACPFFQSVWICIILFAGRTTTFWTRTYTEDSAEYERESTPPPTSTLKKINDKEKKEILCSTTRFLVVVVVVVSWFRNIPATQTACLWNGTARTRISWCRHTEIDVADQTGLCGSLDTDTGPISPEKHPAMPDTNVRATCPFPMRFLRPLPLILPDFAPTVFLVTTSFLLLLMTLVGSFFFFFFVVVR